MLAAHSLPVKHLHTVGGRWALGILNSQAAERLQAAKGQASPVVTAQLAAPKSKGSSV